MTRNSGIVNLAVALLLTPVLASSVAAQGRGHGPKKEADQPQVTVQVAVSAARDVLVAQGFEVVRVEVAEDRQVIYYRAGNQGRGRGHGPPARMVVRRVEERVVLEEAPESLRIEIGIKLGIRL